jgi:hypothetical protein
MKGYKKPLVFEGKLMWAMRDSNSRLPPCKINALYFIGINKESQTYAHNILNKGVPKEVLQTLLGHRSIKTTEIYANWVRKEELERWV